MQHICRGIMKEIKFFNDREEISTMYVIGEDVNLILASYIDKRKAKNIIILTKMDDEVCMSMISKTKEGVYVVDMLSIVLFTKN